LNHHLKWLKKTQSKWTYDDDAIAAIHLSFLAHSFIGSSSCLISNKSQRVFEMIEIQKKKIVAG
jgi:hypothetical protein